MLLEEKLEVKPLVSIIIPTYNRSNLVRKAILSCSNQTYSELEIIVVDDGSIDDTSKVIDSMMRKDPRIKYFRKQNEGLPKALNYGFKHAKGLFLTWTSDDNSYFKAAIEKMVRFLLNTGLYFVYCDYFVVRYNNYDKKEWAKLSSKNPLQWGNKVGPCFLYHRKILENIGDYDPTTELVEDYDYWIRISKQFKMGHLDRPLYIYNVHREALSVRFHKVLIAQIASVLVRVKNNIMSAEKATRILIKHIARKKDHTKFSSRAFLNVLFRDIPLINKISIPYQFYKIFIKSQYTNSIRPILEAFEYQLLNFEEAKLILQRITDKII